MDVGFIGLGAMGAAMARNLAAAGHRVRAWNRSGLGADMGAIQAAVSPADAFQADAVFTMLADDSAIREVVLDTGVLEKARSGVIHVIASTISVAFAGELADRHSRAGVGYVAAPVFGRPDVAAAGQLQVLAAGCPEAIDKVSTLLDVIGRRTWRLGDDPRQAAAVKVAGNMMLALSIEAMAEGVALTQSSGVSPEVFIELMTGTLFGGRAYENYGAKIVQSDYVAGFKMRLGLKDLRLATSAAEAMGRKLPLLDAVRTRMVEAVDAGMGERDWSAIADYTLNHGR